MPDYSKAKIYCIRSSQTEEVYYGSTCWPLKKRFQGHKYDSNIKTVSSKQILQYEDAYIELVEDFPCNNKAELSIRERYYIENNPCVNKVIPGRTRKETYEAYNEANKDQMKAYREAHKDQIKTYHTEYQRQWRANAKSKGGVL